jgi:hypothetical protein
MRLGGSANGPKNARSYVHTGVRQYLISATAAAGLALGTHALCAELCPRTMPGANDAQYPLTDLYIMIHTKDKGWAPVAFTGKGNNKVWRLTWSEGVRYKAACDYDGQVIGVLIEQKPSTCRLVKTNNSQGTTDVHAWCD